MSKALGTWVWGLEFESLEPMQSWTQWHTPAILVPYSEVGSETGAAPETCGPGNLAYARAGNKRLCFKQCRSLTFEAVLWAPRVCCNTRIPVNTHEHTYNLNIIHTEIFFMNLCLNPDQILSFCDNRQLSYRKLAQVHLDFLICNTELTARYLPQCYLKRCYICNLRHRVRW